jgi:hypothetical protein
MKYLLILLIPVIFVACGSESESNGTSNENTVNEKTSDKLSREQLISIVQGYVGETCELTEQGSKIFNNSLGYRLVDNKDGTWELMIQNGAMGRFTVKESDQSVEQISIQTALCLNKDGQIPTKTGSSANRK